MRKSHVCTDDGGFFVVARKTKGVDVDIVMRLRAEGEDAMRRHYSLGMWKLCAEAADEIERLRGSIPTGTCHGVVALDADEVEAAFEQIKSENQK